MAFKLDKDEKARKLKLVEELTQLRGELEDAVSVYNAAVAELKTPVEALVAKYNESVEEARGFAEDIANAADGEFDDKTEKWQEGERGEAARTWIDEWQNADFSEYEIEFPDELAFEQPEHVETLENLPEGAEA